MDLSTNYMGLTLQHPVVASASPLSGSVDSIKRLEDGGVAAIVMFSLFEEQIRYENDAFFHLMESGSHSSAESLSYFPKMAAYQVDPDRHLELIRRATEAVNIPIIASLNCVSKEGWIDYAKLMQEAGAVGLELNIYAIESDLDVSSAEIEQRYLDILTAVKATVTIPVSLKLSPFFSAIGHMAKRLDLTGADGLVLFNRFYQPDIDIKELEVAPTLQLSSPNEIRLPLLWIALLHGNVNASLAATCGVEGPDEVIKFILAGADVIMTAAALLRHGPSHAKTLVDGLTRWMDARGFDSIGQMRGSMSRNNAANPADFVRANYIRVLESYQSKYT